MKNLSSNNFKSIIKLLSDLGNSEKASFLIKYFKAIPGGYGEGDHFFGVPVPKQRKIAKKFGRRIDKENLSKLLEHRVHEVRLTGLFILAQKFEKAKSAEEKETWVNLYLKYLPFVNNWDLVDTSAPGILGKWLFDKDRSIIYQLAKEESIWSKRTSILTTFYFIKQGDFQDTIKLAEIFLDHPHDLMHKATGWMLREVAKRDKGTVINFLNAHRWEMPRTMLRYALEKFEPNEKEFYMKS